MRAPWAFLALSFGVIGCVSDHHVSPWGAGEGPPLSAVLLRPDLDAELLRVDAETAQLGLTQTTEIRGALTRGGEAFVIRGYDGSDPLGRPVHAVRVATSRGVVMAVGPMDPADLARDRATELVPSIVFGTAERPKRGELVSDAFRAGTDLNGDGAPDVVLRNDAGAIEVWHLSLFGSGPYEAIIEASPTRLLDVDGDSRLDLFGVRPMDRDDPIAPRFEDVAMFEDGRYSDRTAAASAWHAERGAALAPSSAPSPEPTVAPRSPRATTESAKAAPASEPAELRLRRALEWAWHSVLSGTSPEAALDVLRREPVPAAWWMPFERHLRVVESAAARRRKAERTPE